VASSWLRAVCLAVAALFCVATPAMPPPPPRPFAAWTLEPGAAQAGRLGCATARAWVSKSGKSGVGVTVRLWNGDAAAACRVELERAQWVVGAGAAVDAVVVQEHVIELAPCAVGYAYLGFEFDNEAAWNRGERQGELRLGAGEVVWAVPATHAMVQLPAPRWGHAERERERSPEEERWIGVVQTRLRYQLDSGFELLIAYQLKWPVSWVWSR
jgi:hypothetical protein